MERIIVTLDGKRVLNINAEVNLEKKVEFLKTFLIENYTKIVIKKVEIKQKSVKKMQKKAK